ncbi:unnamed protein product [Caenorhabditis nigoni]
MESLFVQQEEKAYERHLNPDETSGNESFHLQRGSNQDGPVEPRYLENGTFEGMKKRDSSSSPASHSLATQGCDPGRKPLGSVTRSNTQSTHCRLISSHPIYTNSPSTFQKKHVNAFKDSKKSSSRPTESSQHIQMSDSTTLASSLHDVPLNVLPKKSVEGFNGSQTSMTKNTGMLSTGFKGAIGSSRSHSKKIQTSYRTSKKIKELRAHFGHLGEKQHRQIRRFQEDESGLSCDDKMFLRMYPVPKTDPLGLDEILKED